MRIFISYHTAEQDKARAIEAAIGRRRPGTECYLAPRNNAAGAYWLPRLADEIARADAVLFLAGPRIGPWQELEYYEALRLSREHGGRPRLVPIVLSGQAPGLPFFAQLHQIFAPDPIAADTLAALDDALDSGVPAEAAPAWRRFQPYKGLLALQEADAAFFFGREAETAQILDLAERRPDRIIALLGQSGVGKSSLARAGVLAALRSQRWPLADAGWPTGLKESRAFLPLVVRPGEAPLKELALAFAQLYRTESYEIDREARGWAENFADGAGLGDLLRVTRDSIAAALGAEPPRRFVLYLDQGEELYAGGDADASRRFSALLREAAEHEAFSVLMSLRSDYYTAYQNDADLFHASERVDVLPLSRDVLTEIVRRPALSLGARFESDDMAARVAEATEREPGALPLLSDLMHDMWLNMQARDDGILRWSDNPEIVDIGGPLRKRAEAFLARRHGDEAAVRHLFTLRLANVPEIGEPVRRRARRSECSAAEWALAETLGNEEWRLLSLTRAADGEPVVEVAHERLLRSWPRLADWLAEERELLVWHGQVEREAAAPDAELLAGRRLAVARGWFERRRDDLVPQVRDFILASIAADDRRIAAERRRHRRTLAATAAGLVVALGLAGLAGWQWRVASEERGRAHFSLDMATRTADGLVFDIVQKSRDAGVPARIIKAILDQVLTLERQLAAGGETSPELRRSRAAALDESVEALLALGDAKGALAAAQQAQTLWQGLVAARPGDPDYRRGAAIADEKLGDALSAEDALTDALRSYRAGLAVMAALAATAPDDDALRHEIVGLDGKIGDALLIEGDAAGALSSYRAGYAVTAAQAAKNPNDTGWQADLAICDEKLGDALAARKDFSAALAPYNAALGVIRRLADADPGNVEWQHALTEADGKIGDALKAQGNLAGALVAYRSAVAIAESLAERDPTNVEYQAGLVASLCRVADAGDDTVANYRRALAILARLDAQGRLTADQQGWIAAIRGQLAKAETRPQ